MWRNQKGQALVVVTVFLGALVGMGALTIDVGNLYVAKSSLQRAGRLHGREPALEPTRGAHAHDFEPLLRQLLPRRPRRERLRQQCGAQ